MSWPPRDWRALLALIGSIAGAAVLTAFVWWGCAMLLPAPDWWSASTESHRVETLRIVLFVAVGTISVVIISLGFAINRRSLKVKVGRDGLSTEMDGGEEEFAPPGAPDLPVPAFGKEPR